MAASAGIARPNLAWYPRTSDRSVSVPTIHSSTAVCGVSVETAYSLRLTGTPRSRYMLGGGMGK
jgi:hypothetical protein